MTAIVEVNVSTLVAPTPATLQQTGAFVSVGGTITAPYTSSLLTQLSDLLPLLTVPAAISSMTWASNLVTVTTAANHGLPIGQVITIDIAGAVPTGYNGKFGCTITTNDQFTHPLLTDPGSETTPGTYIVDNANILLEMATTFFAQGSGQAVYVLELGANEVNTAVMALDYYLTINPNSDYTPGAEGYFYSYLVPRNWDGNANFIELIDNYESDTAKTYFFVTTTLSTYMNYTIQNKDVLTLIESPQFSIYQQNALTAISYSGGTVTATTTTEHNVQPGDWILIQGCEPIGYNGYWQASGGTTGSTITYFSPIDPGAETALGTLEASLFASNGIQPDEFSMAAPFWVSLHYNPSTTNKVAPFAFQFVFGVTSFPTAGNNSLLTTLENANVNVIGTGAEGGISDTILLWGTTMDGQDFTYWYSVDWVQINLDLNTANAVINGSNNPINPLYYNQPGIDSLQAVAASTMATGITYGLVLGPITQTALDGPVLDNNLSNGLYVDQTVVNAVPFITYSLENPGDYKIQKYAGLAVIYTPLNGFKHIVYNVLVSELIAFG